MNHSTSVARALNDGDVRALGAGCHADPFAILGPHPKPNDRNGFIVRTFLPGATLVWLCIGDEERAMTDCGGGLFEGDTYGPRDDGRPAYHFRIDWNGTIVEQDDPYQFAELLTDYELYLIAEGRYLDLPLRLGANVRSFNGTEGVMFAVWAPNARSVSVVGGFNSWDQRRHPMRLRRGAGVWELFVPGLHPGEIYKYAIIGPSGEYLPWKADPLARQAELPPRTGSIVADESTFEWSDHAWMEHREVRQSINAPIAIYEVHIESWLRTEDGQPQSWDAAGDRLIPYVRQLGFTHIELLPIAEYPFGGSWGYQPLALFSPTSRLGDPASFARFINRCHQAGIGVIVDWVPAHFPSDSHGLAQFDGTALYEHQDAREGFHHDWNTLIYNAGRAEVQGFLISSALWWLEVFHVDGLRVDAVASMLYRDYSRTANDWIPNKFGGRENLESVEFLQQLNRTIKQRCPGARIMAEESTAWPGVTDKNGLGFDFKWNMGWMHDTLRYFSRDAAHRSFHLNDITFGLDYGFSENYILPLSHDEVVHGKGSLIQRMPGDKWQRFANLRLLLALMWTHPGKKLLFMGCEFGAEEEWDADAVFPWPHPNDELRAGVSRLISDLNHLYRSLPQLHERDCDSSGFAWVVSTDSANCVFAFRRSSGNPQDDILVVANTTPVPRNDYRVGVPTDGEWREMLNSDAHSYGGSGVGNGGRCTTDPIAQHGQPFSLNLTLPPLGMLILQCS